MSSTSKAKLPATPAKTTRTVPLEFKDTATGEILDVIQDNEPDLPTEPDPQELGPFA